MSDFGANSPPPSQLFHEAGLDWADKKAAADLLEDTKSAVIAKWQQELGDMPVNRAEQLVKSQPRYTELIEQIVEARRVANVAWVVMNVRKMEHAEHQSEEANNRQEMRMTT